MKCVFLSIILMCWNVMSYALAPQTGLEVLSANSIFLQQASIELAQAFREQWDQDEHLDFYEIQKHWQQNGNPDLARWNELLSTYFRLRDYHIDKNIIYLYFELETGEHFAYRIAEDGDIQVLPEKQYFQTLIQPDGSIKATPWTLLEDIYQDYLKNRIKYPSHQGFQPETFLNSTATTPKLSRIEEARSRFTKIAVDSHRGRSAGSTHTTEHEEKVRLKVSNFFGAPLKDYDIIFVDNSSYGINMFTHNISIPEGSIVASTLVEHHSNMLTWKYNTHARIHYLAIDSESGLVDLEAYKQFLAPEFDYYGMRLKFMGFQNRGPTKPALPLWNVIAQDGEYTHGPKFFKEKNIPVPDIPDLPLWLAIAGANNVPGGINNIRELVQISHLYGIKVFMDAAQLAPHRPIDMAAWGVDAMVFSGHKMHGYKGAVIAKKGILPMDITEPPHEPAGGTVALVDIGPDRDEVLFSQSASRYEPGSPDSAAIVALGASIDLLEHIGWYHIMQHEKELTKYTFQALNALQAHHPEIEIRILGSRPEKWNEMENRLGVFTFDLFINGQEIPDQLISAYLSEVFAINVRNGCFCAHPYMIQSKGVDHAEVDRMAIDLKNGEPSRFRGSTRMSVGLVNRKNDIDLFMKALETFINAPKTFHADGRVIIGEITFLKDSGNNYYTPKIQAQRTHAASQYAEFMIEPVQPRNLSPANLVHLFALAA